MRCEEIMKRNVECLRTIDTVEAAAIKMRDENVGFLPICDDKKMVLGTLTDRDLAIRVIAAKKPGTTKVADVMSKEVVSCKPSDDVRRAEQLLAQFKKSRIMCLDEGGRLVGVISLSDIAQNDQDAQVARTLREVTAREATTH
jgi:CBS domain-containing protein